MWWQQSYLTAPNDGLTSNFGWSVAISGDTALVGTHPGTAAFVFTRISTAWSLPQPLQPNAGEAVVGDAYGESVGISGDRTIVGAYRSDNLPGAAYGFQRSGTTWVHGAEM